MSQTTRIAIRKGFLELLEQRPLDKISVVDIAEHCGVNRNTFYYYYCDIYALVREVLETELDSVLNAQPPCENWYQLTMRVASFARENRRRVYHLYQSSQRDLLENEYYQVVFGAVEKLVRRTAGDLPVAGGAVYRHAGGTAAKLAALRHEARRGAVRGAGRPADGRHHAAGAGAQLRGGNAVSGFWRCVVYAVVLALAAHPLGQALPRRFHPERPPFRPWKWEKNGRIYSRLGIEKWKKLVPDMSRLLPDMVKKELPGSGAVTAAQADTLVQETCRAEVVHTASCLLGLAFLRLWPGAGGAAVLAVWVLLANLPFMVIQRYNRPRLVRLAALLRKREQKKGDTSARTDTDL